MHNITKKATKKYSFKSYFRQARCPTPGLGVWTAEIELEKFKLQYFFLSDSENK